MQWNPCGTFSVRQRAPEQLAEESAIAVSGCHGNFYLWKNLCADMKHKKKKKAVCLTNESDSKRESSFLSSYHSFFCRLVFHHCELFPNLFFFFPRIFY